MKTTIAKCVEDLVVEKFGKEKWQEALTTAGLPANTQFYAIGDVDDAKVLLLVKALCQVLGVSLEKLADVFGDYWVNVYSQKWYKHYYAPCKNAKDFLLSMDKVHESITKSVPNAHPPRFKYVEVNPKKIIMEYNSARGLIDFAAGLARGVGRYYRETIQVTKVGPTKLEILFS